MGAERGEPLEPGPISGLQAGGEFAGRLQDEIVGIDAGNHRLDVIGITRSDAETDHIDQQFFGTRKHFRGNGIDVQRQGLFGQPLGDRDFGQFFAHCFIRYRSKKRGLSPPCPA
mgnify:CR=1 FL=1